jgi:hypothetical protein
VGDRRDESWSSIGMVSSVALGRILLGFCSMDWRENRFGYVNHSPWTWFFRPEIRLSAFNLNVPWPYRNLA